MANVAPILRCTSPSNPEVTVTVPSRRIMSQTRVGCKSTDQVAGSTRRIQSPGRQGCFSNLARTSRSPTCHHRLALYTSKIPRARLAPTHRQQSQWRRALWPVHSGPRTSQVSHLDCIVLVEARMLTPGERAQAHAPILSDREQRLPRRVQIRGLDCLNGRCEIVRETNQLRCTGYPARCGQCNCRALGSTSARFSRSSNVAIPRLYPPTASSAERGYFKTGNLSELRRDKPNFP